MQRIVAPHPMADLHAALGFDWADGYWQDAAHYELTLDEVERIERATAELHARCLDAVQHVITTRSYARLGIDPQWGPLIEATWEEEPPSLYGRFDLCVTDTGLAMYEYNADTPTSLVEAAVVQWHWLQRTMPGADQYNRLHEALVETWRSFVLAGPVRCYYGDPSSEDMATVEYVAHTAREAGLVATVEDIATIGAVDGRLVASDGAAVGTAFKLYPWEWLVADDYAPLVDQVTWIEPAWKLLLSNKGILAVLHELFPDHPHILPATLDVADTLTWEGYVSKPLLGREGANVEVRLLDQALAASRGPYDGARVYQQLMTPPDFGGWRPVIGSWMIGQSPAGMGIRETPGIITDNRSRFAAHCIRG
ncbi:MAG: glutathionylspermidine synthase family protein [Gemmatimonadaceae bacterium]|nr:glutathionylspermidine synthase family protein [Gemmatimonadaceae bacterium]